MIYTSENKLQSRQIDTMVLSLEDFNDERISLCNKSHAASLALLPVSADKTAMEVQFKTAVVNYDAGVSLHNIAISGRGEDVVLFNTQEKLLNKRVSAIKRKVIEVNDDNSILVFFNLTNVNYYTKGRQSEIVKRIDALVVKMTSRPDYVTVLPFVVALKADLGDIFNVKFNQKILVHKDKEDVDPLVQALKEAYIFDKGILQKIYCKDITKTFSFFPLDVMYGTIERAEDYVTNQQAFVKNPSQPIINLPTPPFTKTNLIEIENLGPEPMQAYTLITISSVIPETAITIMGFSTYKGVIMNMGPANAKNLMLAFPPDALDTAKARVTIKPRKKKI